MYGARTFRPPMSAKRARTKRSTCVRFESILAPSFLHSQTMKNHFKDLCRNCSLLILVCGALLLSTLPFQCALAESDRQLTLDDVKKFLDPKDLAPAEREWLTGKVKAETGLENPRPMPKKQQRKISKAFENGSASEYSVQDLIDAGVFTFRPISNVHPKAPTSDEDKSLLNRDGKDIEVENIVWGKKLVPATMNYGVMHSTEDGYADAAKTIDIWNKDCSEGKRSSSTPFVLGRCLHGRDILVTADFEKRWQRHCSSKLTAKPNVVNWNSIGVEMEHSTEKNIDYTKAETKEAARLWTYIQQRAKLSDNNIVTHGELQGHLPKDHKSYRTDPEGFDWDLFAKEIIRLRKRNKYEPAASDSSSIKTKPQLAIEKASGKN